MLDTSGSSKRIAKNTIYLYLRMGLGLLVSLFTTRVVLQTLGVDDYGIYNVVSGFVTMFSFLNTSLATSVQRFYNFSLGRNNDFNIGEVYSTAIIIHIILAAVLFLLLETLGIWYIYTQMVIPAERFFAALYIFQFSVCSLLLLVIRTPFSAAVMAYERMDFYAYLGIFDIFAGLGIAYAVRYSFFDKLITYGVLNFCVSLIGSFICYRYVKANFKELKFEFRVKKILFIKMLSFSGWNLLETFAYMIKGQGLNMLLNVFFGPSVNAARGVSNMVMSAIRGFQSNVVVAFRPQLVQSYAQGDEVKVSKMFFTLSKVSFVLLSLLSIPVILEIKYILNLWLGDTIPDYTISFTILVLINMIISSLNTPVSQVIHATGQVKIYEIVTSIVICSILPVSWIVLRLGGDPVTVYLISLLVTIFNQVMSNILLKCVFNYDILDYCRSVIIPCIVFILLVPLIPSLIASSLNPSLIRLFLTCVTTVVVAILVTYYFVMNKSEKEFICNFVRNKFDLKKSSI